MKKLILTLWFLAFPALASNYANGIFNNLTTQGTTTLAGATVSLGGNFSTSGAHPLTLTTTGSTTVTLPTSGTLLNTNTAASTYAPIANPTFTGTTNIPILSVSGNQTTTGGGTFAGTLTEGNGSGSALMVIKSATSSNGQIAYYKGGTQNWQITQGNESDTIANNGYDLGIYAYSDTGSYIGQLAQGQRGSGPFGDGKPYWTHNSPSYIDTYRSVSANGVPLNDIEITNGYDVEPTETLAVNPITTTNGSATVTVNWVNCCNSTGPLGTSVSYTPGGGSNVWVDLNGATSVGGLTLSGWYPVSSIVDANDFTIPAGSSATSSATGGGSSVTATWSSALSGDKEAVAATTGGSGFPVEHSDYYVVDPSFYVSQGTGGSPQYQQYYSQVYSPPDTSQTHAFGTIAHEMDLINRGSDDGYAPIQYNVARQTIGIWAGTSNVSSYAIGGGSAHSWNTVFSCFNAFPGSGTYAGVYDCNSTQPDSLVGATMDPAGHGGVGYDIFGAYETLASAPFSTSAGTSTITVAVNGQHLSGEVNGNTVYIPSTYTIAGVTFGGGSYAMSNINIGAGTFTITGSGTASSTTIGGGATPIMYLQALAPYAPTQFWGEWKHGITTTNFHSDDGSIINTQPGNGVVWNDGTGSASVTGAEVSAGNVNVVSTPAGTGLVLSKYSSGSAVPTAAQIPSGYCADWNNTTAVTTHRYCNVGGSIVQE